MKFHIYIGVFLLMVISLPAWAQNVPALKLPEGPLLNRVSSPAEWTITTQASSATPGATDTGAPKSSTDATASKPVKPMIVQVIKEGNLTFEKVINENGDLVETWRIDGLAIINPNNTGWIISPGGGTTFDITDYSKADFAGFDWISLNNFSGVQDITGKHCITFKDQIVTLDAQDLAMIQSSFNNSARNAALREQQQLQQQHAQNPLSLPEKPLPTLDKNSFKVDVEADIDNETRLPVQLTYKTLDGRTMIRTYSFQPSPGALSLPPEVESLIKSFQDRQQRMTAKSAPI